MTHKYTIKGIRCNGCVDKVKTELLKISDITEAQVQVAAPQATLRMQKHIPVAELQKVLATAGDYTITEADSGMRNYKINKLKPSGWLSVYKPILVIGAYLLGATFLIELKNGAFLWQSWMPNFMAGFFMVFCLFKFLDLKGFAESYATYDIIAKKWQGWGYVYAFIEMALGLAYLVRFDPFVTNLVTLVVMSISIIGVLQSVLRKQKVQCACLGTVFNLPMSTVTIIEDSIMIAMSLVMILMHI